MQADRQPQMPQHEEDPRDVRVGVTSSAFRVIMKTFVVPDSSINVSPLRSTVCRTWSHPCTLANVWGSRLAA